MVRKLVATQKLRTNPTIVTREGYMGLTGFICRKDSNAPLLVRTL